MRRHAIKFAAPKIVSKTGHVTRKLYCLMCVGKQAILC